MGSETRSAERSRSAACNGSYRRGREITVVGGGIAGLCAAIACAEEGAQVRLFEAHQSVGGRARSTDGPFKANLGPHAMYNDGPLWAWLAKRDLLPPHRSPRLSAIRMRIDGELRRTPPLELLPAVLRLKGRQAPVEVDFRSWAARHSGDRVALMLSSIAGVFTFHHDPGSLSAAFVWSRVMRGLAMRSPVRYPVGGWSSLVDKLESRARELGVAVETGARVDQLPAPPVIVATELEQAGQLIGEEGLQWPGGTTLCLDLGLRHHRGDPTVVSDFDEAGWVGRYSAANPSVAPKGHELIQAQMPVRPRESAEQAALRLQRLLDISLADWRGRETWRRRQVMDRRSGALDMPGTTWRDRPAVDRGDGVFLAGDMVAAPGILAEVSWASAMQASELALALVRRSPVQGAPLPKVA